MTPLRFILALALSLTFTAGIQAQAQEIEITEIIFSSTLDKGKPVDPAETFSKAATSRIYATIRLKNPSKTETKLYVSWQVAERDAKPGKGGLALAIPAKRRYRTVARMSTKRAASRWQVVVRDSDGNVIRTKTLHLTE